MFAFFKNHPGLLLVALLAVIAAGVLAGHHSFSSQRRPPALASTKASTPPRRAERWRGELDLDKAQLVSGALEQRLADGTRIRFTVNPLLQSSMREFLAGYQVPYSAAVAYELKNGRVLAMASYSHENPRLGSQHLCLTPWAPAASVFKIVTTAALLDAGVTPDTKICYHGGFHSLAASNLRDSPALDTTCRTLSDALAKSLNPVIAKLAVRYLDRGGLLSWAERFGFNKPIPFDLPTRPSRARIPTDKLERARTAAGFWHSEISPLHGAVMAGAVAHGGELKWPYVVDQVVLPDGRQITPPRSEPVRIMSHTVARRLAAMMARTTTIGSGRRGFISRRGKPYLGDITVAGKTGSLSRKKPFLHYSWFVGFAPVERPEIAFAVLLGNPMRWRIKASVGARALLQSYFRKNPKPQKPTGPAKRRTVRSKHRRR